MGLTTDPPFQPDGGSLFCTHRCNHSERQTMLKKVCCMIGLLTAEILPGNIYAKLITVKILYTNKMIECLQMISTNLFKSICSILLVYVGLKVKLYYNFVGKLKAR